ncbi:tyrosine-type recombinase/integrase [Rhodomicrobium lacus]|uniref:tyrosine-type recombinase/integrase n=1 Tax=Rhodomicrobium lacus TaxID=2498452 RepID=UPI000F8E2C2C|nr:tyrosine-type recombinase/integrase [Rhodomicrobium lacus]
MNFVPALIDVPTFGQPARSLILAQPAEKVRDAIALWLSGFTSENTRRAYRREIQAFAEFAGHADAGAAVAQFLALSDGQAHAAADAWRADKIARKLSPASVNRSMAALNSFVEAARRYGLTALRLEAKGVKSCAYRDTRGPGMRAVRSMIDVAAAQEKPQKAARDVAILRLATALGLRRGEIAEMNIGHVDLAGSSISIKGKGRTERETLTIPANVRAALAAWLALRGTEDSADPLFIALTNAARGHRLTGEGIRQIISVQIAEEAGVKARPHGLRHTAITAALDAFNGDFRKVKDFSRHASLETVRRYDDNRNNFAGSVASALDAIIG